MSSTPSPSARSAFLNARGAPPPLALARRLRAALGPQALLLLLLSAAPAHAEYRRIELKILGMDCATCAHGVRVAMQKLDGVATVELSLERAQAEVSLKPDNRLTLDAVPPGREAQWVRAEAGGRNGDRNGAGSRWQDGLRGVGGADAACGLSGQERTRRIETAQERLRCEEHGCVRDRRDRRAGTRRR